jgi:hypothetical protein
LSRLPNGGAQTLAVDQASTWVDDCYCVVANDETDVGYGVFVLWRCVFIHAASDVDAWCNFVCDKGTCGFVRDKRADLARRKRTRVCRRFLREGSDAAKARARE